MKNFDFDNKNLRNQFDSIEWIENSGLGEEELLSEFNALMKQDGKESRAVLKAKLFARVCFPNARAHPWPPGRASVSVL